MVLFHLPMNHCVVRSVSDNSNVFPLSLLLLLQPQTRLDLSLETTLLRDTPNYALA